MNKMKSCIAAALAMLLAVSTASAATIDKFDVVQNTEDGKAVATITVSGASDESYVSLAVINPDADEAEVDPDSAESVAATYQMLKNIKVDEGEYSYSYTVVDPQVGVYTLKIGDETRKFLLSYDELDEFLDAVNASTTAAAVCGLFEDAKEELAIDSLLAYAIDETKLGNAVLAGKPYADVATASDTYKKNAIALILANSANASSAVALADTYSEELALEDISSYDVYLAMDDADKRKVFVNLANADVAGIETFGAAFGEQIILTAISEAASYGEVKTLLDEHTDIIDIDWEDELSGVKATSEIYKGLRGNYYASTEDLLKKVEELVKTQKKRESKDSSSGGSGSVGVSSGADTRTPTTQITPAADTVIFTDLGSVAWAETAIYSLAEKKILSGMGDGIFAPEAVVTREQFVQGIVKAFGFTGAEDPGFDDVSSDDWYYNSVCIAYANGVVSGIDENHFGVGKVLTREEMAALVWRAMEKKGVSFAANESSFGDFEAISDYAKTAANAMFAEGIISGFPNGNFEPKGECTRAQMAVVLEKAYGKI